LGLPHFSCFLPVGEFVAGIEPHASKINVDAWAGRENYGRGTRWRSLGNFGGRAGDRLLSRMRSAITTAAQSIFALFTGPAGARRAIVALRVLMTRWRCLNGSCARKTFSDQLPGVAVRHARRTLRVSRLLQLFAHGAGGKPSERLINRLGMPASDDTLQRQLKRGAGRGSRDVRVLGIDDWSRRKGESYGTVMVDLERREIVDVLPRRSAEETADWLRQHPNVEVVSRDRCGLYAQGTRQGAPQARQVADQFHLLQGLIHDRTRSHG
jgi:hypothetical protein